jgi:hypothetical protein
MLIYDVCTLSEIVNIQVYYTNIEKIGQITNFFNVFFLGIFAGLLFFLFELAKIPCCIKLFSIFLCYSYCYIRLYLYVPEGSFFSPIIFLLEILGFQYILEKRGKIDFHNKFLYEKHLESFKNIIFETFPIPFVILKIFKLGENYMIEFKNQAFELMIKNLEYNFRHMPGDIFMKNLKARFNQLDISVASQNSDLEKRENKIEAFLKKFFDSIYANQIYQKEDCSIKYKIGEEEKVFVYSITSRPI